ncbi:MAG: GNAT family N-acetyltransferase [Symploca sp. SIO1A3]|nr:GNAT family N-acetyltransferase [Symploca sp. SIO1A3]
MYSPILNPEKVTFREATLQEDSIIAQHFYQLWQDNDVSADSIKSDWLELTLQFINQARQELYYKTFVVEVGNLIVGSASCQLFNGLYPKIFVKEYRKYGYIWNVYVELPYRNQGFAKKLTSLACDYLKFLGCTRAILHASPLGKPVYDRMGFYQSNEMRLDLTE